jgi:curved DNA-binding protein CbpA
MLNDNDLKKINPYKLLNLSKNCTEKEIKTTYKKLALKYHPDRPNGSHSHFQVITYCCKSLLKDLKLRELDKQYNELKNNSRSFIEAQASDNKQNIKLNRGNFNAKKFNKLYTENRLETPHDKGYSDWLKSEDPSFETESNNDKIVEYTVPKAVCNQGECVELGLDKINDFTSKNYSDIKVAYNNKPIINKNMTIKEYNSLDELQKERSDIKPLEEKELAILDHIKMAEQTMEENRREIQLKYDNKYEEQYNRLNNRILDFVYH